MNAGTKLATALSFVAALVAVAAPSAAQAQSNTAAMCGGSLVALEETRVSLDGLELSVATAKSDRVTLETRAALVADALLVTEADAGRETLRAEARRVEAEIASIDELLPPIESQAQALAADVDLAERAYLACVETTLD